MQSKLVKIATLGILSCSFFLPQTFAATKKSAEEENIDVTQQQVTKEELAAIFVLSEVCPKIQGKNTKFTDGYKRLAKDYLPNEKNPVAALQSLSKQASFQEALKQARQDAKNAGEENNKQVCQDVINYHS
ncbi:MCR_0457 family protein [Acinetobacter stercoris]|uniref:DUF7944 domain-containing protein n=1 Tax=Acinetobacter stercoris TaxID=2126983 RepID=A0A2U3MWU1_9GAMM|nr:MULTISPECIES: hypothetical protein [Acinetobacter]SPL69908.1 hypothetical protein KPC_1086 [Acinetobacter stercoris]